MQRKSTEAFEREYARLNDAQRKAVEQLEGPVLVIAGPGTGKTQILAIRIGNILLNTDAGPKNILCLTYTEAAASNMRKRLLDFIGPTAYEVTICTFHAFCNSVIRENPEHFLHYSDFEVISDLEKRQLLLQMLSDLPRENPLYRYNSFYTHDLPGLENLFQTIKKENWEPDRMLEDISTWLESEKQRDTYKYKRSGKGYRAGDFKEKQFNDIVKKTNRSRAAIELFQKYEVGMEAIQRYEFEDMIQWVIRKFESDEGLLQKYQEKFQYVLVDEYQDTNGSQNAILFHLMNYFDQPNIFAVGDDDQAIFRFQGANVQNMFDFAERYRPSFVVLTENYRSSQQILTLAEWVIRKNAERLVNRDESLTKTLLASGEHAKSPIRPRFIRYPDSKSEVIHIYSQVSRLLEEGVPPGEIAILFRKNTHAAPYIKLFEAKRIPYVVNRQTNLLEEQLFQHVFNVLQYLTEQWDHPFTGDLFLYQFLHAPFIQPDAGDVARIAFLQRELRDQFRREPDFSEDKENRPDHSLIHLMGSRELLQKAGVRKVDACLELAEKLNGLQKALFDSTPQVYIENLFASFGVLHFALSLDDKYQALGVLQTFFEFVKAESQRQRGLTIPALVNTLRLCEQNDISIPVTRIGGMQAGVELSTLHSAKGREFSHVFMINCSQRNWSNQKRSQFLMPDAYRREDVSAEEDDRRLFFVGLTRARTGIQVSFSGRENQKEELPCKFAVEMLEVGLCEELEWAPGSEQLLEMAITDMSPMKKDFSSLEAAAFHRFISGFRLNPTAMSKYLECPLTFYYENVLRLPGARTPGTGYGKAVHYALERWFKNKDYARTSASELLISYLERGMQRCHSHFTNKEFEDYLAEGKHSLVEFINYFAEDWVKTPSFETEYGITTECRGVPISGKLDRIETYDDSLRVVDFKTGSPSVRDRLRPPSESLPHGGNYWQQMVFYAVLLKHCGHFPKLPVRTALYFIKSDDGVFSKKEIDTSSHVDFLEDLIERCYNEIASSKFSPGCGKAECPWCRYVSTGATSSLVEEEEEEFE
ncbi:MAG: ATP-dependent helicase [Saprospiraceae bacterium]|nr:ATP-dependent helicase [Saprospiraceae bacterium]